MARNQAVIVGRVEVTERRKSITDTCYVDFTDASQHLKAHVKLDATGWIVTVVDRGRTFLSSVTCSASLSRFATRELEFDASGGDALAYFGHLDVRLHPPRKAKLPSALDFTIHTTAAGTSARAAIARLQENLADAVALYRSRYPANADTLQPFIAFHANSPRVSQPLSEEGVLRAETTLDSLNLHWLGFPARDRLHVTLRVEHAVDKAELSDCRELRIQIDDQEPRTYRVRHLPARRASMKVLEAVQADVDFSVVQALGDGVHGSLDVCALHSEFAPGAGSSIHAFATQFTIAMSTDSRIPSDAREPSSTPK